MEIISPLIQPTIKNLIAERAQETILPTDLPGLVSWYDASDDSSITTIGGRVSQWSDKSGNGWHLTQSTSTLRPLKANRRLFFDNGVSPGTFTYLENLSFGGLSNLNSFTIIMLCYATSYAVPRQNQVAIGMSQAGANLICGLSDIDAIFFFKADVASVTPPPSTTTPQVYVAWRDRPGNQHRCELDAQSNTVAATDTGFSSSTVNFFMSNNTLSGSFLGYMYQVIIYDRPLTPAELSDLRAFLNSKR